MLLIVGEKGRDAEGSVGSAEAQPHVNFRLQKGVILSMETAWKASAAERGRALPWGGVEAARGVSRGGEG